MALKILVSQERRFACGNNLKTQCVPFMKEYEVFRHMSLVQSTRLDEPHYFIPHHCVFKLYSTSTKLRVVFDVSCPSSSQKSLNDIMIGPTIQDELYKILLRFRLHRYALTAYIVKIYRQVLIDSVIKDSNTFCGETRKKRKFGLTNLILSLMECRLPLISPFEVFIISKTIKSSFYGDDFLDCANSLE